MSNKIKTLREYREEVKNAISNFLGKYDNHVEDKEFNVNSFGINTKKTTGGVAHVIVVRIELIKDELVFFGSGTVSMKEFRLSADEMRLENLINIANTLQDKENTLRESRGLKPITDYEVQLYYHGNITVNVKATDEDEALEQARAIAYNMEAQEFTEAAEIIESGHDVNESKSKKK